MSLPGYTTDSGGPQAANFANATQTIQQTDASQSNATAQTLLGAQLNAGDQSTVIYTGSDYNAVQAGLTATLAAKDLIESGVLAVTKAQQGINETLASGQKRVLDLAEVSQQGQGGTLVRGLIWIVGLAGGAFVLAELAKSYNGKKAATNA